MKLGQQRLSWLQGSLSLKQMFQCSPAPDSVLMFSLLLGKPRGKTGEPHQLAVQLD